MSAMMPWMRLAEDEQISAYIDGQLDDSSRQSFEARINADPALRVRVEATRTLVQTARQTPTVAVPRNFTLPRTAAAATAARRDVPSSRLGWRIGSALAAAVFVIAIGLDTIGVGRLAQSPAAPASRVAQLFAAITPVPTQNSAADSAKGVRDSTGAAAANQSTAAAAAPLPEATAASAPTMAPAPTRSSAAAARVVVTPTESAPALAPESTPPAEILPPAKAVSSTGTPEIAPNPTLLEPTATPTDEARLKTTMGGGQPTHLLEPTATPTDEAATSEALTLQAPYEITATVESTIEAPAETIITTQTAPPQQDVDLLRVIALIALVAAIVAGIIGWMKR